ncbi:tumor necrosis factor receptor superfamily member 10A-like [Notamacropus eugenii]|uniref:tumor necrosis factor receptor superfamily member 10A-like n=1 Tax=Notamacropus eugenii TaxID=9315 RepID=UPI003B67011B
MASAAAPVMKKLASTLLSSENDRAPGGTCDLKNEYWHDDRCCLYCLPGTRVLKHCTIPHTLGSCEGCPPGEYALKNGLETCRQCAQCREDQEMVRPCLGSMNTKCQCKEGYYCASPDCEMCQRCTERCPEGMEILQGCTRTADTECGAPGTGIPSRGDSTPVRGDLQDWTVILVPSGIILVFILCIVIFCLYIWYKKKQKSSLDKDGRRSMDENSLCILIEDADNRVFTSPESRNQSLEMDFDELYTVKDDTERGRSKSFDIFQHHIHEEWDEFVQNLELDKNEIIMAKEKHPHNPGEQKFEMLLTWRNKLGRAASLFKLLATAHKMPATTKRVQNILNELIDEGIICKRET